MKIREYEYILVKKLKTSNLVSKRVELTEEELKEIVHFFIGGINVKLWRKEIADKIRKVLE